MAWFKKLAIRWLAGGLSKKDLKDVTMKISARLSKVDQGQVIRVQAQPLKAVQSNEEMLLNAIREIAQQNGGEITAEEILDLLENDHGFNFRVFYSPPEKRVASRRRLM